MRRSIAAGGLFAAGSLVSISTALANEPGSPKIDPKKERPRKSSTAR
jgi:hypothetical protein